METQVLSGLLGLLFRPAPHPPGRALVIGWGSGVSVGTMAHAGVKHVDAVELEPAVLRGARPFERYNRGAATHPAVRIIEADGRNVLTAQPRAYEVIVSEPSNPWMSGASGLFTREFFQLVRRRLRPDGVFVQWIQAYEISRENVRILIATLRSVFPWVMVFRPRQSEVDLLLLASPRPIQLDARALARRMREPGIRDELERIHVRTVGDLLTRAFLPPERVDALHRGSRLNTDDNVLIEFAAPKDLIRYRASSVSTLFRWLHGGAAPVERGLVGAAPGLGLELVDATLRLGDLESSAQRLRGLRQQPGAAARLQLIAQLERAPVDEDLLRQVLAEHPLRAELESLWGSARPERERLTEAVRVAARFASEVRTLRVLGLLAARASLPAESWLLLQAAERLAPHRGDDLRWVLARLSRRLALHEQALQIGLQVTR
jgi:SAM-dependent methyltransferase